MRPTKCLPMITDVPNSQAVEISEWPWFSPRELLSGVCNACSTVNPHTPRGPFEERRAHKSEERPGSQPVVRGSR